MNWFTRKPYVSPITDLLRQLHRDRPELASEQQAGHDLLRNKKALTAKEIASDRLARVTQQSYVYHNK